MIKLHSIETEFTCNMRNVCMCMCVCGRPKKKLFNGIRVDWIQRFSHIPTTFCLGWWWWNETDWNHYFNIKTLGTVSLYRIENCILWKIMRHHILHIHVGFINNDWFRRNSVNWLFNSFWIQFHVRWYSIRGYFNNSYLFLPKRRKWEEIRMNFLLCTWAVVSLSS